MKPVLEQLTGQAYRWRWKAMRLREEANKLQAEVEGLQRKEASMRSSLSWRLTAPLRWLDGAVRAVVSGKRKPERERRFAWLDEAEFVRGGDKVLADYSLTSADRSSPGMRRVTNGILRGAREASLPLVPVDLLGPRFRNAGAAPDAGLSFPRFECRSFFLADAGWQYTEELRPLVALLREAGIPVTALVHDAIPFDHPELCFPESVAGFGSWMDMVFEHCSRVICVSEYSADRIRHHLALRRPERVGHCEVCSWLPGNQTWGGDPGKDELVPTGNFMLCVGTVEPRKNYGMLLQAMEELWAEGRTDCTLVIFGAKGWSIDDFIEIMSKHPEWGRRLWWFDGGTDEHLHALYHACTAFALPSIDEGFSQPLSEAASLGKPVVLSDLPVFRERVISGGYYFDLQDTGSLKRALIDALAPGAEPTRVRQASWEESARNLVGLMLPPN